MTEHQIEQRIRELRQTMFDNDDLAEQDRISDEIEVLKEQLFKIRQSIPKTVGMYSGLTKSELAKTGTVETDWF